MVNMYKNSLSKDVATVLFYFIFVGKKHLSMRFGLAWCVLIIHTGLDRCDVRPIVRRQYLHGDRSW